MPAAITSIASYLPSDVESNDLLAQRIETSDDWIRSRTGIAQRHLVKKGVSTADLAVAAMDQHANLYGQSAFDALVLATTSPDRTCPATAPEVASRAGLGYIAAYDVSSACSGYVYGLATAAGLVAAGIAERVALVTSETFSYFVNPLDRNTAPLFGDAATVTVVEDSETGSRIGPFDLGSDGANVDMLHIPSTGAQARSLVGRGSPVPWTDEHYLQMNGRALFVEAVGRMSSSCRTVVKRAEENLSSVDKLIVHQANARIVGALCEELDFDSSRAPTNIAHVGNTLASSIPLLLAESARDNAIAAGETLLLTAFGAGLSWGSCLVHWESEN